GFTFLRTSGMEKPPLGGWGSFWGSFGGLFWPFPFSSFLGIVGHADYPYLCIIGST
ncbi:hypothetical protein HMPREF6485_0670, partial [Segatella buccae ATCC 33574]